MSGVFKAIGKVFKSVVKVLKKIALPALAIGLVVLTGGAALGVLPAIAGAGGIGSMLGLSAGLTSILSTAATAATIGFGGALLTGKNPIKGAVTGMLIGGVTGGIGALAGAGGAAASAAGAAGSGAGGAGLGAAAAGSASAIAPAAATGIGQAVSGGSGLLSGIGHFISANPLVSGQIISGIGSGLAAGQQAKDAREAEARTQANYANPAVFRANYGTPGAITNQAPGSQPQAFAPGQYDYDPATGRIVPRVAA